MMDSPKVDSPDAKSLRYRAEFSPRQAVVVSDMKKVSGVVSYSVEPSHQSVDFAIITILDVEFNAVRQVLDLPTTISRPGDPYTYHLGIVPLADGYTYHVLLTQLSGMGNPEAAAAVTRLTQIWHPQAFLLVGLAGGLQATGVRVGDIVVPEFIYYYEPSKLLSRGREHRARQFPCDNVLFTKSKSLGADERWLSHAGPVPSHGQRPRVRCFGAIATGEKVIARRSLGRRLREECPEAQAVAMEGAGVALAAAKDRIPFLEIRGISDLADGKTNDDARLYAAQLAATFTRALLYSHPTRTHSEMRDQLTEIQRDKTGEQGPGVFIGSGVIDLPEHVREVSDAVFRHGMRPLMLEKAQEHSSQVMRQTLRLIDQADIYVGVFAQQYGVIPSGYDLSLPEMEYRRAVERQLPIRIYLAHETHTFEVKDIEFDAAKRAKLVRLKNELQEREPNTRYRCDTFRSARDLSNRVVSALGQIEAAGLARKRRAAEDTTDDALNVIPVPPKPYYAHPYILIRRFFGRDAELARLDAWAKSGNPMLVVEALGGVGKSALTWQWVRNYIAKTPDQFAGVLWWSFYFGDSMTSNFLRRAVAYVTRRPLNELEDLDLARADLEQLLINELEARPYLLILDGIERILRTYRRVDAAQVSEDKTNEINETESSPSRCADPRDGELLRKLAHCTPSKILISTRKLPMDLRDTASGLSMPHVVYWPLGGLKPEDALTMMHALGVHGNAENLRRFMADLGYHTLLLEMLAGSINNYYPARGDFDAWYQNEGRHWNLARLEVGARGERILKYALEGLPDLLRHFLCQVAAFDYPVDYAALAVLNPYVQLPPEPTFPPPPDGLDVLPFMRHRRQWIAQHLRTRAEDIREELAAEGASEDDRRALRAELAEIEAKLAAVEDEMARVRAYDQEIQRVLEEAKRAQEQARLEAQAPFHRGLTELEERGLLQWDRNADRYDLHPVVRAYAFDELQGEERREAFSKVRDYFSAQDEEDLEHVTDASQLLRTREIYRAYIGEESWDQAFKLFRQRLSDALTTTLGEYGLAVELLMPLFPEGPEKPPCLSEHRNQLSAIHDLASNLRLLGRIDQALKVLRSALILTLTERRIDWLRSILSTYVLCFQETSAFWTAEQMLNIALEIATESNDPLEQTYVYLQALHLYADTGRWEEAETAYQRFVAIYESSRYPNHDDIWDSTGKYLYAQTLLARGQDARAILQAGTQTPGWGKSALDRRYTRWLQGMAALAASDPDQADHYFQEALDIAKRTNVPPASYRVSVARARLAQGATSEARQLLDEALTEEALPEYRAELQVAAAEIYLALGEYPLAQTHAMEAYRLSWAEGPPYCWRWELDRAKNLLAALNIHEPSLAPFDLAAATPVPFEQEIRALVDLHTRRRAEEVSMLARGD